MLMENKREGKKRTSPAALEAERRRRERLAREQAQKKQPQERRREQAAPERSLEEGEARRKTPPRERTSRAAQTANRQRKERKEDSRLEGLRQKQTKEAKQRTRHRLSPVFWRRLIIIIAVAAAVLLTLTLFFRVKYIDVTGNHYYSVEDITDVCGVAEGDNLLTLSRGEIAGNIMANCEYVSTVRVSHVLPNRVSIVLTEYPAGYAISDVSGYYYLISSDGTVLKQINERDAADHIRITQLQIKTPVTGETAVLSAQSEETDSTRQFSTLTTLLRELEAAELIRQVTEVSVSATNQITLRYEDRFTVSLGSTTSLAYKLEHLKIVIAEQKDYATGTIDLTYEGGKQAVVKLDE